MKSKFGPWTTPDCRVFYPEILKLRLVLDVDYDPNGVGKDELEGMLYSIADHAANVGLMSGETPATVNMWQARVEERK